MNNTGPSGLARYALWARYSLVVMNGRGVENYRRARAELRKLADSAEPRERVKIGWIGPVAAARDVAAKARWRFIAPAAACMESARLYIDGKAIEAVTLDPFYGIILLNGQ